MWYKSKSDVTNLNSVYLYSLWDFIKFSILIFLHVLNALWLAFKVFGACVHISFLSSLFLLCILYAISLCCLEPNRMLYNEFCGHLVTLTALIPSKTSFWFYLSIFCLTSNDLLKFCLIIHCKSLSVFFKLFQIC